MTGKKLINRKKAREKAFIFLFENSINGYSLNEMLELKKQAEGATYLRKVENFTKELFCGVKENQKEIDKMIGDFVKSWEKDRISKVAISILRLSIFEILYREDIPPSVSINEAVELAKKYGSAEEPAFVNGILGSIYKEMVKIINT